MDDLRRAYRTTVFIGLAMIASLLICALIVEFIKAENTEFRGFVEFHGLEWLR